MSNNIEEDIKIVKVNLFKIQKDTCFQIRVSIENILLDRERLIKENKELKEYIAISPNLDEMTATKYTKIQQEGYLKGRAEEQQKTEYIINEKYISKQVVKDRIKELDKLIKECDEDEEHIGEIPIYIHDKKILEKLLEDK